MTPDVPTAGRGGSEQNRWTRAQQLGAVFFAHLVILVFVLLLIEVFKAEPATPALFILFEALILLVCVWPLVKTEAVYGILDGLGWTSDNDSTPGGREAMVEKVAGAALYIAFALQLAALVPLLDATGGPINSPFGPMAVAIAVFTPFLANIPKTVLIVGVITAVYYVFLVGMRDDLETRWAFLAVNLSILGLSVLLTLGSMRRRNRDSRGGPPTQPADPAAKGDDA